MKSIIFVAVALLAVAVALPVEREYPKTLESEYSLEPEGSYKFLYETEDGINRKENGELKEALDEENKPHNVVVVHGEYSYTDPEGKSEKIEYYADETGFHARGPSIPVAPVRR